MGLPSRFFSWKSLNICPFLPMNLANETDRRIQARTMIVAHTLSKQSFVRGASFYSCNNYSILPRSSSRPKSPHNLQPSTPIQRRISNSIILGTPLNQRHFPSRLNLMHILSTLHIDNLNSTTLITATSKVCPITAETQCLDRSLGAIKCLLADEVGSIP